MSKQFSSVLFFDAQLDHDVLRISLFDKNEPKFNFYSYIRKLFSLIFIVFGFVLFQTHFIISQILLLGSIVLLSIDYYKLDKKERVTPTIIYQALFAIKESVEENLNLPRINHIGQLSLFEGQNYEQFNFEKIKWEKTTYKYFKRNIESNNINVNLFFSHFQLVGIVENQIFPLIPSEILNPKSDEFKILRAKIMEKISEVYFKNHSLFEVVIDEKSNLADTSSDQRPIYLSDFGIVQYLPTILEPILPNTNNLRYGFNNID